MLGNAPVAVVLPTTDLNRSRTFYVDTLGLSELPLPSDNLTDVMLLDSGGSMILVYLRHEPTKAEHTVAAWMVDDFDRVVDGLLARGVRFETYAGMPDTDWDSRGVASDGSGLRSVWFLDPDGNILSVNATPMS